MTWTQIAARASQTKTIIGGILIVGGVAVSALGMLKVPAQQAAIAQKLEEHNKSALIEQSETNKKLDVLICLQAKLDSPIRCVAKK